MTIFDTIRYPVDDLCLEDLMDTLPPDIWTYWYYTYWRSSMPPSECIKKLKEIILEEIKKFQK
jgi:hypothetical protein